MSLEPRHVIIGPTQKAWATCANEGNDPEYCWIEYPFISEWVGKDPSRYITRDEFETAWKAACAPEYSDHKIEDLATLALSFD